MSGSRLNESRPVIDVRSLTTGPMGVPAVRGLDLHVDRAEVVALLGPNGAGKSVVLAAIAGHLPVIDGDIVVLGRSVLGSSIHDVARRGLAYVPSDRGLFTQLSAAENLRIYQHSASTVTRDDIVDLFPLLGAILSRKVGALSGGEQQTLAVACQLITDPAVLLIDELSRGLAPVIVNELLRTLRTITDELGVSMLVVEQDATLALDFSDRAYVLRRGRLMITGDSHDLRARSGLIEESYLGRRRDGPEIDSSGR